MISFTKLAGENIRNLNAYKPGKPIEELKREFGLKKVIKLASNENPLGPSPKVKEAINKILPEISRYPLGDAFDLRLAFSSKFSVPGDKLIFGSGSNEIIELLIRTFVKPGEHVISPSPSFSVYSIISQAMGSFCKWIPTSQGFNIDLKAILNNIDKNTRVIFLANPNNPTGTYIGDKDLEHFVSNVPEDVIIVMDEAYIEFADAIDIPNTIKMQKKYPNLVLMRTFSKAYGLAGLRMGYCIANEECCEMLNRVRQPFNTNMIAQTAAIAALKDDAWLKKVILNNKEGKEYIYQKCSEMGINYIPTQANFMLIEVGNGEKIFNNLLRKGIIVRYMGSPISEHIRVSIGTNEENEIFISELKEICK